MKKQVLGLLLSICLLIGVLAVGLPTLAGGDAPGYYSISAAREGDVYYVTVRCDYSDFTMLNGEFLFTYDTNEWELLLEDCDKGPVDPAKNLTPLPAAEVGVNTEKGEVRLAFISTDGSVFADGWVTMLVLPFRALHPETEDIRIEMNTDTLVAEGDTPEEKVDVLEENEELSKPVEFEQPVAKVPVTVITTTTTTTTTVNDSTTTANVIDPAIGAELYAVEVFVAGGKATVTVTCDYNAYVLDGLFVFTYPTDVLDLIVDKKTTSKLSQAPGKAVNVIEEKGEVHIGFATTDGSEFLDGPLVLFKADFNILDAAVKEFELGMSCSTLARRKDENSAQGVSMLDTEAPRALRWKASLEPTPTTTTAPQGMLGDVDDSKKVDSTDARLTLQYAVQKITADRIDVKMADVDGDGAITSSDARLMLQYAVEKIHEFPRK